MSLLDIFKPEKVKIAFLSPHSISEVLELVPYFTGYSYSGFAEDETGKHVRCPIIYLVVVK